MLQMGWKKWGLLAIVLSFVLVLAAACGTATDGEGNNGNGQEEHVPGQEETDQEEVSQGEGTFPATIVDGSGTEVTIEDEPQTLITMIPSITETVFALGLGDKVIAVDDYSNYPEEALEKEKVGAQEINVEKILSLLPDVIFVTTHHQDNYADVLDQLREAGITVVVVDTDATRFEDVYESIRLIARVTGTTEEAEALVSDLERRLEEIKAKAQEVDEPKKVWVEVSPRPDIYTPGTGTFMHEMLEAINAVNAAATAGVEGWAAITEEEIVQLEPEVIITTYGYYVDNPVEEVLSRDGWSQVPAVQHEQVFDVDNDTVTRPGPRIMDGVETLAKLIYPEIFTE
ncbi:iron complex transport system substrate-binding protein [Caldalkalibacillus uzonensis]|uniref:Iron complex transport system substrate-binding protein n=1 Tax=Caldalkalibacillus uzonensis TaxID=353224 RepID=A0ABU0CQI1_9BACI|nr:ABC transporter substrate-binding protein [Caldalkalibacillus uzonensis]MDQ0338343.1 iron complex transport system substrate-binding protein [Caldalkalibacillus uzonensis]